MTHTNKICAVWPLVTVVQQNEYVRILVYGYLSSNKNINDHQACVANITCNNCACNSTVQASANFN